MSLEWGGWHSPGYNTPRYGASVEPVAIYKSLRLYRGQFPPAWGLKTLKICSRNTVAPGRAGWLPPQLSPEVFKPRPAYHCQKTLLLRGLGRAGFSAKNMFLQFISWTGPQEVTGVEQVHLTWPIKIQIWQCWWSVQHRQDGAHL